MNTYRKTAITVGILFIACTVTSILGPSLAGSINAPDYLSSTGRQSKSDHHSRLCWSSSGLRPAPASPSGCIHF